MPASTTALCMALSVSKSGAAMNTTYGMNSAVFSTFRAWRDTKEAPLRQKQNPNVLSERTNVAWSLLLVRRLSTFCFLPVGWRPGCRCVPPPPPRGWTPFWCRIGCRRIRRAPGIGRPSRPPPSLSARWSGRCCHPARRHGDAATWLAEETVQFNVWSVICLTLIWLTGRNTWGHTGYCRAEAGGIENHQSVLQAAPTNSLGTNKDQCLSLERRNLCHFLVDLQLMSVEFCLMTDTVTALLANQRAGQLSA